LATPEETTRVAEPSEVLPFVKFTVPPGVLLPVAGVTIAVNCVDALGARVGGLADRAVPVATKTALTVTETVPVEVRYTESPE
jgi:hypothetical protein